MRSSLSPKVFVSYSHDSEQHKDWVRRLSERLRFDGIDVLLDQWELGPGDDVTYFMEQALSSCYKVLIVCTEEYIKKANKLKGGVGYERMIITAEIAKNLKIQKFIPILRNVSKEKLPKFLGPRIYVDLRMGELDQSQYDILLRSLHNEPKHKKPPLGQSPYVTPSRNSANIKKIKLINHSDITSIGKSILKESTMNTNDSWHFHWHRAVHEYCGYKLFLIFVRFATGSIFLKESIIADLRWAKISDFMIFHLYSDWDILIRVWADEETIQKLRLRFVENSDLNKDRPPEFIMVQELTHFSETANYSDGPADIKLILSEIGLSPLEDVQNKGNKSPYFERLKNSGLILDETVGFHPERIQFYITIRSMYALEFSKQMRLKELIATWKQIRNRSIYITSGSAIRVVIKGQAENYYDIYSFLQAITKEFTSVEIMTQTMLVANRENRMSTCIDFERADKHILDHEIESELPEISALPTGDGWKLIAKYVEVRPKLLEDKQKLLIGLLRAKARSDSEEISRLLAFFPAFEDKLRQGLVPLIIRLYGNNWQSALDDLKSKEGITAKKDNLVFGDLCKLYKRIILDKQIIVITPLNNGEFCAVMDAAPIIRNEFAHKTQDLKRWDDLFAFCSSFIPIYSRLLADISSTGS